MCRNLCEICVPRREPHMRLGTTHGECLRPRSHGGVHLFQNPEGTYFTWEDDDDCGCCEPEDTDRCFVFKAISSKDAEELGTKRV